jgi:hypothetical protein
MSRVLVLPDEVLRLVMQHVPLRERLGSCCLVSKGFRAAAVAVTRDLEWNYWSFRDQNDDRADSLMVWLDHYGQQLTRLAVNSFRQPLQQLPCPNLLELVLIASRVQLGPAADGTAGVIRGCTKLTKLDVRCNILDVPRGTVVNDSLSGLLQLEHLQVVPMSLPFRAYSVRGLHSSILPCLKHLTCLHVHRLSVDNVAQLGALTNLRDLPLRVDNSIAVGPSSVPGFALPASLTRLE